MIQRFWFLGLIMPIMASYAQETTVIPSNVYNISSSSAHTKNVEEDNKKPKLENFASYNDFLQEMYLYNKTQEDKLKPRVIVNLPTTPLNQPEYSTIDENSDITAGSDSIPVTHDHH